MKFAAKGLLLVCFVGVLAGCHNSIQWFPPAKNPTNSPVNCVELKRQQLYNETNMNTETNNTLQSQRDELDAFIKKNCQ